jgi:hypothetical protein
VRIREKEKKAHEGIIKGFVGGEAQTLSLWITLIWYQITAICYETNALTN